MLSAPPDARDPLSADELEHFHWLVIEPRAVAVLTKPQLARLLDDRERLIDIVRELVYGPTGIVDALERAESVLIRVAG